MPTSQKQPLTLIFKGMVIPIPDSITRIIIEADQITLVGPEPESQDNDGNEPFDSDGYDEDPADFF